MQEVLPACKKTAGAEVGVRHLLMAFLVQVLDRYPNSPKLLQAYALYLESVKSNPSRASRYRVEADRLEKESSKPSQTSALTDG